MFGESKRIGRRVLWVSYRRHQRRPLYYGLFAASALILIAPLIGVLKDPEAPIQARVRGGPDVALSGGMKWIYVAGGLMLSTLPAGIGLVGLRYDGVLALHERGLCWLEASAKEPRIVPYDTLASARWIDSGITFTPLDDDDDGPPFAFEIPDDRRPAVAEALARHAPNLSIEGQP